MFPNFTAICVNELEQFVEHDRCHILNLNFVPLLLLHVVLEHGGKDATSGSHDGLTDLNESIVDFQVEISGHFTFEKSSKVGSEASVSS